MNCKKCNYKSPITGMELIKGGKMIFIGLTHRLNMVYKRYTCVNCNNIVEIQK